jgi:hypothetical protein
MKPLQVVLISTYELGRQPFGLASPAAWLQAAGCTVTCQDLTVTALESSTIQSADLVAFHLPMHTATRIAVPLIERVKALNPQSHLCCYGLYAPLNERYLRNLGVKTILGGEFEEGLVALAQALQTAQQAKPAELPLISLQRQQFQVPARADLPTLQHYAFLEMGDDRPRTVGYTEATRGCKHTCRHCPIVPVYGGQFRVVQRAVVLADIRNQVAAGAEHITFGDPDFFNGPGHAIPIVEALHAEFPDLTYDVTIKVEHLRQQVALLPILRDTSCLFITSAVEAVDDEILRLLDKGHTRADFIEVAQTLRELGLTLNPTFVAFNPWTSVGGYRELLQVIADLDLVDNVAPIQYAIRLLITAQSALLTLPSIKALVHPFDEQALVYPWYHPDPHVDALQQAMIPLIEQAEKTGQSRREIFAQVWALTNEAVGVTPTGAEAETMLAVLARERARFTPRLSEPWYC